MFSFLDDTQFIAYVTMVVILNLTPGADVLFICGQSLKGGYSHGISAALGISTGLIFYVVATVFGMAELFRLSPHLFNIVKFIGVGYLMYLAYKAFTTKGPSFSQLSNATSSKDLYKTFKQGFITNLLNPKVGLFFFTFLPQFINERDKTSIQIQLLCLGTWFVLSGTFINVGYGFFIAYVRQKLLRNSFVQNSLQKITGMIFGSLALKLLWTESR